MTESLHTPDSLADRLDALLPPGGSNLPPATDDPLIEAAAQLAAAPRPQFSPAAMSRIQAQVMTAYRQQATSTAEAAHPAHTLAPLAFGAGLVVVVGIVILLITVTLGNGPLSSLTPTPTLQETFAVSPTPSPTETETPTATPSTTASPPPTGTPSQAPAATAMPGATALPTSEPMVDAVAGETPTISALPTTLVIEGPVESIAGNIITVYGLEIVLNPAEPILAGLQIGDIVHVEGNTGGETNAVQITAVIITTVSVDIYVNTDGQVYRDEGDCSNPPPPWAPAEGWREQCGVQGGGSNPGGNNPGQGNGNNNGRDDDDDDEGMGMGEDD